MPEAAEAQPAETSLRAVTVPAFSAAPVRQRALRWLEGNALLVVAVVAVAALSLASIPAHLSQDGWLALVAGRIIAQHGLPHHDYLTVMAHGVRWVDQQWLAQIILYGLQRLGGLPLMTVLYVMLTSIAFAQAITTALSLGAQQRHVIWVLPLAAFFYLATATTIRTQGFAYPLFAATLWLLASEIRRPRARRVWLVFPILVLWSNLHGSVTLGAGMAVLFGLVRLGEGAHAAGWRGLRDAKGLAFTFLAPLCLLLTPYGGSIVSYYRSTLFNPAFGKLVSEWGPVTNFMILAVPLLLLIVATIWLLGRSGARTPVFDHILLVVLALGAIDAVRNITWFGLAAVVLLPATITQIRPEPAQSRRRPRLDATLAVGALGLFLFMTAFTLARSASWFESTYPTRAVATVATLVRDDPGANIFADVRFADWLVWRDPSLSGHVAYDTSFENLTVKQLQALNDLGAGVTSSDTRFTSRYAVLVLAPHNYKSNHLLLARPGIRIALRSKRVIIAFAPLR
jgi:hypothetical protein